MAYPTDLVWYTYADSLYVILTYFFLQLHRRSIHLLNIVQHPPVPEHSKECI
jgi:hypothetical protein